VITANTQPSLWQQKEKEYKYNNSPPLFHLTIMTWMSSAVLQWEGF
jgi:hypothetical protein